VSPRPRLATAAVVDYGAGNLRSVAKALERSGLRVQVTSDPANLARADAVVLPGVGAFRDAAETLRAKGLDEALRKGIDRGQPYLGICLGLQLLFDESSEHGKSAGFGLLPGRVERFPERGPAGEVLRVPHIGWNEVEYRHPSPGGPSHPMLEALPERDTYYFVHAYRPVPSDPGCALGEAVYGEAFTAAAGQGSLFAVQFHPEKSQNAGRRLLDAFAAWVTQC
jgi:glutamine amidotransferase